MKTTPHKPAINAAGTTVLACFLLAMPPSQGLAATYYIRPDGGNAKQCNGLGDAPYTSAASGDCAWNHPFEALGVCDGRDYPPHIKGGDTVIIKKGQYRMGHTKGVYDQGCCYAAWPWDCTLAPIPSGTKTQPTRILGEGWDNAPDIEAPQLYGVERAASLLNLTDSSYVEVANLEITDHASCGYNWLGGGQDKKYSCNYDKFPYGDWALSGIVSAKSRGPLNSSQHVTLRHINVHGLGLTGMALGNVRDWTIIDSSFSYNGFAGIDGDSHTEKKDGGFTGAMHFVRTKINNNGCVEDWRQAGTIVEGGCYGQEGGGYGDGIGFGAEFGDARWSFQQCQVKYNTSDGLDFLYAGGRGSLSVEGSEIEGNAGDQLKLNLDALIVNNKIVTNCDYFEGKSFASPGAIQPCRGGGGAITMIINNGAKFYVLNNSFSGTAPTMIGMYGKKDVPVTGTEEAFVINNLFVSQPKFWEKDIGSDYYYTEDTSRDFLLDRFHSHHNLYYGTVQARYGICLEKGSICNRDPRAHRVDHVSEEFDFRLPADSVAVDAGWPAGELVDKSSVFGEVRIPTRDFTGAPRQRADIGMYETGK